MKFKIFQDHIIWGIPFHNLITSLLTFWWMKRQHPIIGLHTVPQTHYTPKNTFSISHQSTVTCLTFSHVCLQMCVCVCVSTQESSKQDVLEEVCRCYIGPEQGASFQTTSLLVFVWGRWRQRPLQWDKQHPVTGKNSTQSLFHPPHPHYPELLERNWALHQKVNSFFSFWYNYYLKNEVSQQG